MSLSTRVEHLTGPVQEWLILGNLWQPLNPGGYVNLGIAENHLMHETLTKYLEKMGSISQAAFTYGDGSKRLRAAITRFLSDHFQPATPLSPEHVIVTNGMSPAIEHLGWALADPGDTFLLGQPFYNGFIDVLTLRPETRVAPVSFHGADPLGPGCVQEYEKKVVKIGKEGGRVAGLILCHPHNPLGRCYSTDVLVQLMKLCQRHRIHLISDEAYALSVFPTSVSTDRSLPASHSVLSIVTKGIIDEELIHMVWGLSKDFGASGFHLGVIVSRNAQLQAALGKLCLLSIPSSLTEHVTANMLEDDTFIEGYIRENQMKLGEQYEYITAWARLHGIEYASGVNAAFFLWADLGTAYLKHHPNCADIDADLGKALDRHKVYIAPGFASEEPGWCRIVFTQPREQLDEGLARILSAIRGVLAE